MPRVGVIFGGRSGEHEVSLASAASIIAALEQRGHEVVPIGIARDGRWVVGGDPMRALAEQARVALPSGDDTGSVKKALADRAESVRSAASTSLVRSEPAGSSAAALTLLMPTLEPRLQGFTKQGTPSASTISRARAVRRARQSRRRTITCSTMGRP